MIKICTQEKIKGIPFLLPKTARELNGIKFLGDVAAHNFLINVDPKTIVNQLPFIIIALEELTSKF